MRPTVRLVAPSLFGLLVLGCGGPPPRPVAAPGTLASPPARQAAPAQRAVPAQRAAAPAQPAASVQQADFEIHLDRSAMSARRVSADAVTAALGRFFESHPYFSLSDLQELPIRSDGGADVPLRSIGTVEVWFGGAATEIVVSQGAGERK